jgi:hypothetical protein
MRLTHVRKQRLDRHTSDGSHGYPESITAYAWHDSDKVDMLIQSTGNFCRDWKRTLSEFTTIQCDCDRTAGMLRISEEAECGCKILALWNREERRRRVCDQVRAYALVKQA